MCVYLSYSAVSCTVLHIFIASCSHETLTFFVFENSKYHLLMGSRNKNHAFSGTQSWIFNPHYVVNRLLLYLLALYSSVLFHLGSLLNVMPIFLVARISSFISLNTLSTMSKCRREITYRVLIQVFSLLISVKTVRTVSSFPLAFKDFHFSVFLCLKHCLCKLIPWRW